jgi:hypothetical protein
MCMCGKCSRFMGVLVLLVGIMFLLQDRGIWNFFGLSWYTVAFVLAGAATLGKSGCRDCMAGCCGVESAPAKPARRR